MCHLEQYADIRAEHKSAGLIKHISLHACKHCSLKSKSFRSLIFHMNVANKSQTGLFPEASQDMTGNSNDSEQNLQLLKIQTNRAKKFRKPWPHANQKIVPLTKSTIYGRKGRKTWLTFQLCCVHCVKSLYTKICSRRVL